LKTSKFTQCFQAALGLKGLRHFFTVDWTAFTACTFETVLRLLAVSEISVYYYYYYSYYLVYFSSYLQWANKTQLMLHAIAVN